MLFKKKDDSEEILPVDGLIEDAKDYNFYDMQKKDRMIGFFIGFVIGFLAIYFFFGLLILSVLVGTVVGVGSSSI